MAPRQTGQKKKPPPAWLRDRTPELPESDFLVDEIACSHQLSTGEREKGRLYFTTSLLIYSGTSSHVSLQYHKVTAHAERKRVVLKTDGRNLVLIPEEPRLCEPIARAVSRAARAGDASPGPVPSQPPAAVPSASVGSLPVVEREPSLPNGVPVPSDASDDDLPVSPQVALESLKYVQAEKRAFSPLEDVRGGKLGAFTLPVPWSQACDTLFSEKSQFLPEYHKKLGNTDLTYTKWEGHHRTGGTRLLNCKTPSPFGMTPLIESHRIFCYRDRGTNVLLWQAAGQCPKVNSGDCFRVETMMELVPEGKQTRATFYGYLKWEKKALFKAFIQGPVEKGLQKSFGIIKEVVPAVVAASGNGGGQKRGKKEPSLLSPAPLSDTTAPEVSTPLDDEMSNSLSAQPAPASPSPVSPAVLVLLPTVLFFLVVACMWSSGSLASVEEKLRIASAAAPEHMFQENMRLLQAHRSPLLHIKHRLSNDGFGLGAMAESEKEDLLKRLADVRAAISPARQPHRARHDSEQQEQQQQQQQQEVRLQQEQPQEPYRNRHHSTGPSSSSDSCGSELIDVRSRYVQNLGELRSHIMRQAERMSDEQADVLFRIKLLTVVALLSFAISVRQLISSLL